MITRSVQLSSEFAFNKNLQRVTATFLIDFLKLMFFSSYVVVFIFVFLIGIYFNCQFYVLYGLCFLLSLLLSYLTVGVLSNRQ